MTEQKANRSRGIYLLPNLLTTASLFAGFYAIGAAFKGHFNTAAMAIFIAMLLDGLDGRVARMTNTQSAFGAEYDSLSDMVSFGVAPPLVAYTWALSVLGKLGFLAAFMYTAATALRLARFNTQIGIADKRFFQGLSCTASAGIMAGLIWVGNLYQLSGHFLSLTAAAITILCALLMVSKIRYHSFKEIDLHNRVPFTTVLIVVLVFAMFYLDPPRVLCMVFVAYGLSGPILTLWNIRKKRLSRRHLADVVNINLKKKKSNGEDKS
jgi:CDP-diacylglycerol--serine O-phosphatidyltransferase